VEEGALVVVVEPRQINREDAAGRDCGQLSVSDNIASAEALLGFALIF
jgi:hypothetical protein